jgi:hypothetical protein
MFLHCVYYWMRSDLSEAEKQTFLEKAQALIRLKSVKHGWFGKPAETDRPIIDRTYDYALVLVLEDAAGHDAFQADPEHHAIRNVVSGMWKKILIYDFED